MASATFIETQMDDFIHHQQNGKRYRNAKGPITLHEGIELAISEWRGRGRQYNQQKPNTTIDTYLRHLWQFQQFAHKKWQHPVLVSGLDRHCLVQYRRFLYSRQTAKGEPLAPRTIQGHLDALSSFFNVMKELGYVDDNPIHQIESKENRRARVEVDPEEESPLTLELLDKLLTLDFDAIGKQWGLRDKGLFYCMEQFVGRHAYN